MSAFGTADPQPVSPFDSMESSRDYVGLLLQSIEETAAEVDESLRLTPREEERRREAYHLAAYKLERLHAHVASSRRLLNDLGHLRLMLHGERVLIPVAVDRPASVDRAVRVDPLRHFSRASAS